MQDNSVDQFADSRQAWLGDAKFEPGNDLGGIETLDCRKVWVTSDTHFCHKNILIYEAANRPFKDRDEMNEELIRRWNEKVGDDDVVFHLGDFSFGGRHRIEEIVKRLKGRKFLLLGNHDREQHFDWVGMGFERVFAAPFLFDHKFIMSHEPLKEIPEGKVNVFGHVHGSKWFQTTTPNSFCACVERWDCAPVDWDYVRSLYN